MISTKQLSQEIRKIYQSNSLDPEPLIETLIEDNTRDISSDNLLAFLEELCKEFEGSDPPDSSNSQDSGYDEKVGPKILSLILGKEISTEEFSTPEFQERVTESFSTIFDSLNKLIRLMNINLLAGTSGDETIRTVIGSHLEGQDRLQSLEAHIKQIEKTFLVVQKAFKNAALSVINKVLAEMDPQQISAMAGKGLKIGPLRKAELYDIYEKKHKSCRNWLESGRVTEELLREFEKKCQKMTS